METDGSAAAFDRLDVAATHTALSRRRAAGVLPLDDQVALLRASGWLGRLQDTLDLADGVVDGLQRAGRVEEAAMVALENGLLWTLRGDVRVGVGWIHRAARLLSGRPRSPSNGYLRYLDAMVDLEFAGREPEPAVMADITAIATEFDDLALRSLAMVLEALVAIRHGAVLRAFGQLDEAMLPVLAARIPPIWAGDVYCTVIHVCHALGDFRRMREWTEATDRWCDGFGGEGIFGGICRIHRLQLRSLVGSWPQLEVELAEAGDELAGANCWAAGEGFYQLGELRRLRGDLAGAELGYDRCEQLGIPPLPGRALLQLDRGDPGRAWNEIAAGLEGRDSLSRAPLLLAAVTIGCAARLADEAAAFAAELTKIAATFAGPGFHTWSRHAEGLVQLAQNRPAAGVEALNEALAGYRELGDRYRSAQLYLLLGHAHAALGRDGRAAADRAAAGLILADLGASMPPVGLAPPTADRPANPGGLTDRELEVLRLVAGGGGNRAVARELVISEKTVGRHLSNIFGKLQVSSRTAAAAWARDHNLL